MSICILATKEINTGIEKKGNYHQNITRSVNDRRLGEKLENLKGRKFRKTSK